MLEMFTFSTLWVFINSVLNMFTHTSECYASGARGLYRFLGCGVTVAQMSGGLFYWLSTQRPRDHRHCRECRTQTHKRINTHIRFLKPHLGTTEQSTLSDCSVKPCTADTTQCSAGLDPNRSLLSTSSLYWVSGIATFCMNSAWNDQVLCFI